MPPMYGAAIPEIRAQTEDVPTPMFLTSVGTTSDVYMQITLNAMVAPAFPIKAKTTETVSVADAERWRYCS